MYTVLCVFSLSFIVRLMFCETVKASSSVNGNLLSPWPFDFSLTKFFQIFYTTQLNHVSDRDRSGDCSSNSCSVLATTSWPREVFGDTEKVQDGLADREHDNLDVPIVRCIDLEGKLCTAFRSVEQKDKCELVTGIDGVGKTTLAHNMSQYPGFSLISSLPDNLRPFRPYFDEQTEDLKRGYFNLCNIVVSQQLLSSSDSTVRILDRFWPSTIAYQLAHQRQIDLASMPNPLPWPTYLARPSHILYLYLSENKRLERMAQRQDSDPIVLEEQQLASDNEFRMRLDTIYRRVENIHVIETNGTPLEVAKRVLQWFIEA